MSAEFWAMVGIVVTQFVILYNNYRATKSQEPLVKAQAEDQMSEGWVKLAQEYQRQIANMKGLEVENASLRPLVLKLALQEKELEQHISDKEDWKKYANILVDQLKQLDQMPIPFQRYPTGDSEKMKTIRDTKDKMKPVKIENEH